MANSEKQTGPRYRSRYMTTTGRSIYDQIMVKLIETIGNEPLDPTDKANRDFHAAMAFSLREPYFNSQIRGLEMLFKSLQHRSMAALPTSLQLDTQFDLEQFIDIKPNFPPLSTRRKHLSNALEFGFGASMAFALYAFHENKCVQEQFENPRACLYSLMTNQQFIHDILEEASDTALHAYRESIMQLPRTSPESRHKKEPPANEWRFVLRVPYDDPVVTAIYDPRPNITYSLSLAMQQGLRDAKQRANQNPQVVDDIVMNGSGCPLRRPDSDRALTQKDVVLSGIGLGAQLIHAAIDQVMNTNDFPWTHAQRSSKSIDFDL